MLRVLMDEVYSMQEQMNTVTREMEILSKNWKERLQFKNTVAKVKNTFDGVIGRQDMTEERISVLEDISAETTETSSSEEPAQNLHLTNPLKPCKQEKKGMVYLKCWEKITTDPEFCKLWNHPLKMRTKGRLS